MYIRIIITELPLAERVPFFVEGKEFSLRLWLALGGHKMSLKKESK